MKIAVVHHASLPKEHNCNLFGKVVSALQRRGHQVEALLPDGGQTSAWPEGTVQHQVQVSSTFGKHRIVDYVEKCQKILRQIEGRRVLSFERVAGADTYYLADDCHKALLEFTSQSRGAPEFLLQLLPEHRTLISLEKQVFASSSSSLILCPSQLVKTQIQEHYEVREPRMKVITPGVDLEEFQPRLREQHRAKVRALHKFVEDEMIFLFLSTDFERDGLAAAIQAIPLMQSRMEQTLKLVVIGAGAITPYRELARNLRCLGNLVFLGEAVDTKSWLGAADVLLSPAYYRSFSYQALQGLASGLPVITTRYDGISDIVNKRCGMVLEHPDDAEGFSVAADRLANFDTRRGMALYARLTALRHSVDETAEKIAQAAEEGNAAEAV